MALDSAATVLIAVAIVALAAAGAAAVYASARRNRVFEPAPRRVEPVVEEPLRPVAPARPAGGAPRVVEEERYRRTVERGPADGVAHAGLDDPRDRPPLP